MYNKLSDINYYESELYKITLYNNKFKDKFYIYMNELNINIQRIDSNIGWGQDLKLNIFDKLLNVNKIITVGNSDENIKTITITRDEKIYEKIEKNYYENEFYKIFYISESFNDRFKVDYDEIENKMHISRIDIDPNNGGWGQNLKLKYIDKNNNKEKIIPIGPSKFNKIFLQIELKKIKYKDINYYESENYIITLHENKFNDIFMIFFYEDNNTIYIKRTDVNEGWGQILFLKIYDIKNNNNYIIYIGSSKHNNIYKKIDLTIRKSYIAMTTIPTRIQLPIFLENLKDIINNQTYPIENIFITIPNKYKRFKEIVPDHIIQELEILPKVIIIELEEDLGPASKYLGPLIKYYDIIKDQILIIIDDDRKYNKNLVKNFTIAYNSFPEIVFSSGLWSSYFNKDYNTISDDYLNFSIYNEKNNNKFYQGQGLGGFFGFALKVNNLENFIKYNLYILSRISKSFFHDEGIILGYLKYNEEKILYLSHYGCNFIKEELADALCNSNLVNRGNIEKQILKLTNLELIF